MDFLEYKQELYMKFHKRIKRICWIIVPLVLAIEILMFFFFCGDEVMSAASAHYARVRILIPCILNFSTLIAYTVILESEELSVKFKTWASCFEIWELSAVVSISHNYFSILLMLPCIPVLASSLYGDKKITNIVSLASLLATGLSVVTWVQTYHSTIKPIFLITNVIVTLLILVCCYMFAIFIMGTQIDQTDFVMGAYTQQQELIQEMHIDPLTKMYNRAALEDCVDLYIKKFHEGEFVPHLVLIDVDHFKEINDTYGHNNGDVVLKTLSNIIHKLMKSARRSFRFGGDEMVLLFGPEEKEQIATIVEAIQKEFCETGFAFNEKARFTVSIGIAKFYKGLTSKSWFELADSAMYKSKEGGRNCITFADVF